MVQERKLLYYLLESNLFSIDDKNSKASLDEMRDVIDIDEPTARLLAAL